MKKITVEIPDHVYIGLQWVVENISTKWDGDLEEQAARIISTRIAELSRKGVIPREVFPELIEVEF